MDFYFDKTCACFYINSHNVVCPTQGKRQEIQIYSWQRVDMCGLSRNNISKT